MTQPKKSSTKTALIASPIALALCLSACASGGDSTPTTPTTVPVSTSTPANTTPSTGANTATPTTTTTPAQPSTDTNTPAPTVKPTAPTPVAPAAPAVPATPKPVAPAPAVPSTPAAPTPAPAPATLKSLGLLGGDGLVSLADDKQSIVLDGKRIAVFDGNKKTVGKNQEIQLFINADNQLTGATTSKTGALWGLGQVNGGTGIFAAIDKATQAKDLPTNVSAVYDGDALYKTQSALYKGTVNINVDFGYKNFDGVFKFPYKIENNDAVKLGEDDDVDKYPAYLFDGKFTGNKLTSSDNEGISALSALFHNGYEGLMGVFSTKDGHGAFSSTKTSETENP